MAHQIAWLIPNHVILTTLNGPIVAAEVQIVADKMYDIMAATPTPALIHTLIDVREATIHDKIWTYSRLNFRRHPNNGWSIVIGDSRLGGLVIAILSKALNQHIRYCESLNDALKILSERNTAVADYLAQ